MIFAGDIGGTNSRFGLFDDQLKLIEDRTIQNKGRGSFIEVARQFLWGIGVEEGVIRAAAFGVAGAVRDGRVTLTNLPWELDERALSQDLSIPRVSLINDLQAHAEGIELLGEEDLITLAPAPQPRRPGNRAIIAAGTGLGEAGLVWDEQQRRHHAVACEGGHCDFAPQTDREWQLVQHLRKLGKPLSWESVLSGRGLRNLYDFLIGDEQLGKDAALASGDPSPAEISAAAVEGSNRAAVEALNMFVAFYGAEAGNLALKYLSTDGIYLGGGIAPQIARQIQQSPDFLARLRNKGPDKLQRVLESIGVFIINCPTNSLYGAANHAQRMTASRR